MDGTPTAAYLSDQNLREVFDKIDDNHNGVLETDELVKALRELGLPATPTIVAETLEKADTNGDGVIQFEEFREFVRNNDRALKEAFAQLDCDGDGVVTLQDLRNGLQKLGFRTSEDQLRKLFKCIDADSSGDLTYPEFFKVLWLIPSTRINDMFTYWNRAAVIDISEMPSTPADTRNTARVFIAGGVAGAFSRTSTAPLDRMKIIMQLSSSSRAPVTILGALRAISAEGSLRAFWRGNGANCLKIAPETASKFVSYELLKHAICSDVDRISAWQRFIAGSGAGVIAQTCIYPLELAKTRLAAGRQYKGIADVLRSTVKYEGPRALFKGLGVSLAGIIPYAGTDLTVYETIKNAWMRSRPQQEPTIPQLLVAGTVSSVAGQLVAYPFALVRTRLQAQGMKPALGRTASGLSAAEISAVQYRGARDAFVHIVRTEGPKALYRGMVVNMIKVVPAVSLSYVVYERLKSFLKKRNF